MRGLYTLQSFCLRTMKAPTSSRSKAPLTTSAVTKAFVVLFCLTFTGLIADILALQPSAKDPWKLIPEEGKRRNLGSSVNKQNEPGAFVKYCGLTVGTLA